MNTSPQTTATGIDPATVRILRMPAVSQRTGLSVSTLYRRIKQGSFPPPVDLGGKAVGWHESTVNAWVAARAPAVRS